MTRPLQVTFRNMAVAPVLEEEVRARAAWLETFYSEIVGCRVLIEFPHRHRSRGRPVHIRVELSVPGEDIVVNQETTRHLMFGDALSEIAHRTLGDSPTTGMSLSRSTTPLTWLGVVSRTLPVARGPTSSHRGPMLLWSRREDRRRK